MKARSFTPGIIAILSFAVLLSFPIALPKSMASRNSNIRSAKNGDDEACCWNLISRPTASTAKSSTPTASCSPSWAIVDSPNPGVAPRLSAVTGSGNDVWAVGSYTGGGLLLHWDGSAWTQVPNPNVGTGPNELFGVVGSGSDVWAVGRYWAGAWRTLTMHWDGSAWSVVPSPNPGTSDYLNAVGGSGNDEWAGGNTPTLTYFRAGR